MYISFIYYQRINVPSFKYTTIIFFSKKYFKKYKNRIENVKYFFETMTIIIF